MKRLAFLLSLTPLACTAAGDVTADGAPDGKSDDPAPVDAGDTSECSGPHLTCAEGTWNGHLSMVEYVENAPASRSEVETTTAVGAEDGGVVIMTEQTVDGFQRVQLFDFSKETLVDEIGGLAFYHLGGEAPETAAVEGMCSSEETIQCTSTVLEGVLKGSSTTYRFDGTRLCVAAVTVTPDGVANRTTGCLEHSGPGD